jgi:hypothetical protein
LVYSEFGLDRFSVYSESGLGRFSVYSESGLGRFLVYSGFGLDMFQCNCTQSGLDHYPKFLLAFEKMKVVTFEYI